MTSDESAPVEEAVDAAQATFSASGPADPMAAVEERLEIESIAQMVETMSQSQDLNRRLQKAFGEVRGQVAAQDRLIGGLQRELRTALLDLELLRRASASAGQSGVLDRRRHEAELTRAVMPPEADHAVLGVKVNRQRPRSSTVNCGERLHLCKAACCRIFSVPLTASEVQSDRYDWSPKEPYNLRRTRTGCAHLQSGGCACTVRDERPLTCSSYTCENDPRIWKDFANYELNPELAERLKGLHVATPQPREGQPEAPLPERTVTPAARPEPAANGATPVEPEPASAAPSVAPPDFSELRANRPAEPATKFVPPAADED